MSILLPHNFDWTVANWVSFGFFHDSAPHLGSAPRLANDIRFCIEAEVDTLDLRQAGHAELEELARLLELVLEDTRTRGAAGFKEPEMQPVYMEKLGELGATLRGTLAVS